MVAHSRFDKLKRSSRAKNYVKMNAASKERDALVAALKRPGGRVVCAKSKVEKTKRMVEQPGQAEEKPFDKLGQKCHLQKAMVVTAEAGEGGNRPPMFQQPNPVEKYIDLKNRMEKGMKQVNPKTQTNSSRK